MHVHCNRSQMTLQLVKNKKYNTRRSRWSDVTVVHRPDETGLSLVCDEGPMTKGPVFNKTNKYYLYIILTRGPKFPSASLVVLFFTRCEKCVKCTKSFYTDFAYFWIGKVEISTKFDSVVLKLNGFISKQSRSGCSHVHVHVHALI